MDPPRISPPAAVHVPMTSKEMLAEPSGLNPSFGKTAGLVCTLCSADIGALCLGCKGETTLYVVPKCHHTVGRCNHTFHFHCLSRWMRTRVTCPTCENEWEWKRRGDPE